MFVQLRNERSTLLIANLGHDFRFRPSGVFPTWYSVLSFLTGTVPYLQKVDYGNVNWTYPPIDW